MPSSLSKFLRRKSTSNLRQLAMTQSEGVLGSPDILAPGSHWQTATRPGTPQPVLLTISNMAADESNSLSEGQALSMTSSTTPNTQLRIETWTAMNGLRVSNTEEKINKVSDTVRFTNKSLAADEWIQAVGEAVLETVPAVLCALETISKTHPFLAVAYIPFKMIYTQEMSRRDNHRTRQKLLEKMKDTLLELVGLEHIDKDTKRRTPDGQPLLGRLEELCDQIEQDIRGCWNAVNAQEKESLSMKFIRASRWNRVLAEWALIFEMRRDELHRAISMHTASSVDAMRREMRQNHEQSNEKLDRLTQIVRELSFQTSQERAIGEFITGLGGIEAIMKNSEKIKQLIQYEGSLSESSAPRMQGPSRVTKNEQQRLVDFRKDYDRDVNQLVAENLGGYIQRFAVGLEQTKKQLTAEIQHVGDRTVAAIHRLSDGPHTRIKDKIMYHIWREQGWHGNAKSRPLVLALRDYLVERVDLSKAGSVVDLDLPPLAPILGNEVVDPEVVVDNPLEDIWVIDCLHVKHLVHVQQAFDYDLSGYTTVSEVNTFTQARPKDWSLPRWIAYWAVGWQLSVTRYCTEIEEIFNQMSLLRKEIGDRMPGNQEYVNKYLHGAWQCVIPLTSAVKRDTSTPTSFMEKFEDYVIEQEKTLETALQGINYDIDTVDTVSFVIAGAHLERVVFVLLALILRRHLAKFHLCLSLNMNDREFDEDLGTISCVITAVWQRFQNICDIFQHQQIPDLKHHFESFSCGLFRHYWNWQDSVNYKYFMVNEVSTNSQTIEKLAFTPSEDILNHQKPTDYRTEGDPNSVDGGPKPGSQSYDISGTWHGFFNTRITSRIYSLTLRMVPKPVAPNREGGSIAENELAFEGDTVFDGIYLSPAKVSIRGTLQVSDAFRIQFHCDHEYGYMDGDCTGVLDPIRDTIAGTWQASWDDDISQTAFFFKRIHSPQIINHRPLVAKLQPAQLWTFAINCVLDNIRRQRPSYIRRRIAAIKRCLDLIAQSSNLTDSGMEEYSQLKQDFTYSEFQDIYQLYDWYGHPNLGWACDSCGDSITSRSRLLCLDCSAEVKDEGGSLDFCLKLSCRRSAMLSRRGRLKHLYDHLMVKTKDVTLLMHHHRLHEKAKWGLHTASINYAEPEEDPANSDHHANREKNEGSDTIVDSPSSLHSQQVGIKQRVLNGCLFCGIRVTAPCWYCIDCHDWDAFVCNACEDQIDSLSLWQFYKRYREELDRKATHNACHTLIRFGEKPDEKAEEVMVDEDNSSSNRLSSYLIAKMEERVWKKMESVVQQRFSQLEERLDKLGLQLDRLDSLEDRLSDLLRQREERLTNTISALLAARTDDPSSNDTQRYIT